MRALLLALVVVMLAGCGFQLRKELVLPTELATLRVEASDLNSGLVRSLEAALRRSGAAIVDSGVPVAGVARLRIATAALTQRPLSVGGNGRVQEYALVYRVEFELIDAAGLIQVPLQPVQQERIYSFDSGAALGSPGEEELVREELEREVVAAILRQIGAALSR